MNANNPAAKNKERLSFKKETNEQTMPELILNDAQMSQLMSLMDGSPKPYSHLAGFITAKTVDDSFFKLLEEKNWAKRSEDGASLTEPAKKALSAIFDPHSVVQLILGSQYEMAVTELFSSGGFSEGALTIYTDRKDSKEHVIHPGLSPSHVSDALLAHLLSGPNLDAIPFNLNLPRDEARVLFGILDLIYTRRLQAKISDELFPVLNFSAKELWQRMTEIWLGTDYLWLSAVVPILFRNIEWHVEDAIIDSTLSRLSQDGYLVSSDDNVFQPSEFIFTLCESVMPLVSFGSVRIACKDDSGMQLGFLVGLGSNLVLEVVDMGKETYLNMNGVSGRELMRLLFEIGLPEDERESPDLAEERQNK